MASVEVFCRNVKTVLAQRNIRIKDLAEKIGVSESYLSLVLSGTRRNLNDEYKDRIASCLNMTMSQLYSDEFTYEARDSGPVFVEDPARQETTRLVDTFLSRTNLLCARAPFYLALAGLNDRDTRAVRTFFSLVLRQLSSPGFGNGTSRPGLLSLSREEQKLLAVYSVAGDGARTEWVKVASDLDSETFDALSARLASEGFIELAEDTEGTRSHVTHGDFPVSSVFTSRRLRDIHLTLATAMETYDDQGPFFERTVAEHLLRAGRDTDALEHFKKAARLMESEDLWREAAGTWHQASVLSGLLDKPSDRSNCLADAARCLCATGETAGANEFAQYACRLIQEQGASSGIWNVCIMMGNMMRERDPDAAIEWYGKGIKSTPLEHQARGVLLVNLASALLEAAKLDEAEDTLRETSRWTVGRDDARTESIKHLISLNLGLIEYQRRNWKRAREHFESCLQGAEGTGVPLQTVWHNLGMLMYRDDNMKMAQDHLLKAQALHWEHGSTLSWAYAAIELAKVAVRAGDLGEAERRLRSADPYLGTGSVRERGWVLLIQGTIARARGRANQAIDNGRQAVEVFQREGAERELAVAALWLSTLYTEAGDAQQAAFLERRAFQIYEKRHWDIRELHRERALLDPAQQKRGGMHSDGIL